MGAEARVRVKLDGTSETLTGIEKVRRGFQDLEKSAKATDLGRNFSAASKLAGDFGFSLSGVVAAADRASQSVLGLTSIDITGAKRRYAELEQTITALAIKSGRSVEEMKGHIRSLAQERHVSEKDLATGYKATVGEVGAQKTEMVERVVGEVRNKSGPDAAADAHRFAVKAVNNLGVKSEDELRRSLAVARDVSKLYNLSGGEGGLASMVGGMDLSGVYIKDEESRNKLLTRMARTSRDLPPDLAQRKVQNLINGAEGNTDDIMLTRTLRSKGYIDEATGRRDPNVVIEESGAMYRGRFGKKGALGPMIREQHGGAFGPAYSMYNDDPAEVARVAREAGARAKANHPAPPTNAPVYEKSETAKREARTAAQETLDTNVVGKAGQKVQDRFDSAFDGRPGTKRVVGAVLGVIPGAMTVAATGAAISLLGKSDAEHQPAPRRTPLHWWEKPLIGGGDHETLPEYGEPGKPLQPGQKRRPGDEATPQAQVVTVQIAPESLNALGKRQQDATEAGMRKAQVPLPQGGTQRAVDQMKAAGKGN